MRNTISQKIKLGIMVLAGVLIFTISIYIIGNKQSVFTKSFEITSIFKNARGMRLGNNVRYLGINVGNVEAIEIINDTAIRVTMKMDAKTKAYIKRNAIAKIKSDGIVGDMIINIVPGEGFAEPIKNHDEIKAYEPIATDKILSTLSETNENAALLTAGIVKITNSINNGEGTLAMLINDKATAQDIRQIITNLKETTQQSAALMKKLDEISGLIKSNKNILGILLNDTLSAHKVRTMIDNLDSSGKELHSMSASLNHLINNLSEGDNSLVNTLANDSLLKKDLKETLENINSGSQKFDENMEALKHHPLFRGYFKDKNKEK